ncbi:MAG TPA: hypothetical protein VI685_24595 [Candidatus Angelobacter sp.]
MPFTGAVSKFMTFLIVLLAFAFGAAGAQESAASGQSETSELRDSIRQMQVQIQQMQGLMREMKEEADHYRSETRQLEHELELTRQKLNSLQAPLAGAGPSSGAQTDSTQESRSGNTAADAQTDQRLTKLEEDQELMNGKIEEQYQTKVESASKHRVKLSGILLMNIFNNKGFVDHLEVPGVALPATPSTTGGNTGGSFGATFRQSEFGLEVYGPTLAGAKTQGNFVADFFGEFPETVNGSSSGSLRIRTGTVRLDWSHTSLVAGMDSLFFSPLYATSFASVGIPALSYAGNLWGWTPQLRVEHRFSPSEKTTVTISAGILDPLTGETPPNEFLRLPGAGESSRQPAYAARLEWRRRIFGQPLAFGVGSYYSRENWGFNRNIDGWAATNDWLVPFGTHFSLSGVFYYGRAIGGLGAGIGRSVVFNRPLSDPTATLSPLETIGGWSQLKFKPGARLEFNVAAGQDSVDAADVRGFALAPGYFAANLTRNRSEFANFIYRPRSNLLFSTEFRTLRTYAVDGTSERANQLNLVMGVLF